MAHYTRMLRFALFASVAAVAVDGSARADESSYATVAERPVQLAQLYDPGEEIYAGEVVGEHTRDRDLNVNICKTKKLTNVRAAGSDEKIVLPPAIKMSLEEMLEYINEDELVEVTPHHLRIRKILLDPIERKRKSGDED